MGDEIRYVAGYSARDVAEQIHNALEKRTLRDGTTRQWPYQAKADAENDAMRVYRVTIESEGMALDEIDRDTRGDDGE